MRFVVAHEVRHQAKRHHGPAFWLRLGEAMPNWRGLQATLEGKGNEHLVV